MAFVMDQKPLINVFKERTRYELVYRQPRNDRRRRGADRDRGFHDTLRGKAQEQESVRR